MGRGQIGHVGGHIGHVGGHVGHVGGGHVGSAGSINRVRGPGSQASQTTDDSQATVVRAILTFENSSGFFFSFFFRN